jgi:hypothetical protein
MLPPLLKASIAFTVSWKTVCLASAWMTPPAEFSGIMSMSYSDRPQLFFVIERQLIKVDSHPLSEDSVEDPISAEGYGYLST